MGEITTRLRIWAEQRAAQGEPSSTNEDTAQCTLDHDWQKSKVQSLLRLRRWRSVPINPKGLPPA